MDIEKAIKMANAELECLKRSSSGKDKMCNMLQCDECSLNYDRGNIGEMIEWLNLAIKCLEWENKSNVRVINS